MTPHSSYLPIYISMYMYVWRKWNPTKKHVSNIKNVEQFRYVHHWRRKYTEKNTTHNAKRKLERREKRGIWGQRSEMNASEWKCHIILNLFAWQSVTIFLSISYGQRLFYTRNNEEFLYTHLMIRVHNIYGQTKQKRCHHIDSKLFGMELFEVQSTYVCLFSCA